MNVPNDRKYNDSHEWIRSESDGTVTIGITDHAQAALGDLVYIDLPKAGRTVTAGEAVSYLNERVATGPTFPSESVALKYTV